MTKAFPSRRPRDGSWVGSAIAWAALAALVLFAGPLASAQDAPAPPPATKGSDTPAKNAPAKDSPTKDDAKDQDKDKGKPDDDDDDSVNPPQSSEEADRWEDPNAAVALANTFPELVPVLLNATERTTLIGMSTGQSQLDVPLIEKYVRSNASDLTRKSNIAALANPAGNPAAAKAIEKATADLLQPLLPPITGTNQRFRSLYVQKLVDVLKPILKGNLHSRTMAMIVLSRTADPVVLPVFEAQLNDPEQLLIVKLLASVGITNAAQNGRRDLGGSGGGAAAALTNFLKREPDVFWPAQFRALEALGSLRLATATPLGGKAEFADAAVTYLLNTKAQPDVRVWAAWALGMLQIPSAVKNYNYPLVAHGVGTTAADIAESIAHLPAKNNRIDARVVRLTDLMVQLNLAFAGDPEARNSGLSHANYPSWSASQPYILEVEKRVRDLTKSTIALSQAIGAQIDPLQKEILKKSADLRQFLAKPPSAQKSLYAGGPEYTLPSAPKVASGATR